MNKICLRRNLLEWLFTINCKPGEEEDIWIGSSITGQLNEKAFKRVIVRAVMETRPRIPLHEATAHVQALWDCCRGGGYPM